MTLAQKETTSTSRVVPRNIAEEIRVQNLVKVFQTSAAPEVEDSEMKWSWLF